ncbi:MAG: ADP-ribosylglycohydrolase family protein [Anaerotruncus sp.]|nr:ADP-ribosylglycohydrolase family protein [Anaerotruncus sp.]
MQRIRGGLYGLLIGDALGVPYEFREPGDLPALSQIEFVPPSSFYPTYPKVPAGTWSDDGAQALCLLDSLLSCKKFSLPDFAGRLLAWYHDGLWAVDGVVFDVGVQTGEALCAYAQGMSPERTGSLRPDGKGNGALMRVLPLALWHQGSDRELVLDAHAQCLVTHAHLCNQVCCALYCLVARRLLSGLPFSAAYQQAGRALSAIYTEFPEHRQELAYSIRPEAPLFGSGTGYVVDCLRSAFLILQDATSYEDAVKRAVALGHDTDTTACVTGGLAGIQFGFADIPQRWIDALRNRSAVEELLLNWHSAAEKEDFHEQPPVE